jgi:hypothetical protein
MITTACRQRGPGKRYRTGRPPSPGFPSIAAPRGSEALCAPFNHRLLPHSRQTDFRASPLKGEYESYKYSRSRVDENYLNVFNQLSSSFHLSVRKFCPNYPSHRYQVARHLF